MEIKRDPFLYMLAAVVVVGTGLLIYTRVVTWEIGAAFVGLYILPSIFGRKEAQALLLVSLAALTACGPDKAAQRASNTADVAGYAAALEDCVQRARVAKSMDVFDVCAKEADRRYGFDGGAR